MLEKSNEYIIGNKIVIKNEDLEEFDIFKELKQSNKKLSNKWKVCGFDSRHHFFDICGEFKYEKNYEFLDRNDNREILKVTCARAGDQYYDEFCPKPKIIKEEDLLAYRDINY